MGSLFGGSRVLQAVARDNLLWFLKPFAYGSPDGDEPRVAVAMTWLIAEATLFAGDLDVIAPVITAFFIMSYAMVNLTCFIICALGIPNFRPLWKYYNKWLSLLGTSFQRSTVVLGGGGIHSCRRSHQPLLVSFSHLCHSNAVLL